MQLFEGNKEPVSLKILCCDTIVYMVWKTTAGFLPTTSPNESKIE